MALRIAQKQECEPIMSCFDDHRLNPVGYRATSGRPTTFPLVRKRRFCKHHLQHVT
jgi:hypothetical protein